MNKLPENVREGMDVFDSENHKIGTVETMRFGDEAVASGDAPADAGEGGLMDSVAEAIWPDDMPEAERAILLSEGYILLDADGLFASDRYVRPGQISSVTADGIHLSVHRDDLVKA